VSFLSMIERGERVPHVETLEGISLALNISLSELFDVVEGSSPLDDVLRPLSDFARSRHLTARDVEKLLGVARAMFAAHPASAGPR
jgi:hypothetical protein